MFAGSYQLRRPPWGLVASSHNEIRPLSGYSIVAVLVVARIHTRHHRDTDTDKHTDTDTHTHSGQVYGAVHFSGGAGGKQQRPPGIRLVRAGTQAPDNCRFRVPERVHGVRRRRHGFVPGLITCFATRPPRLPARTASTAPRRSPGPRTPSQTSRLWPEDSLFRQRGSPCRMFIFFF